MGDTFGTNVTRISADPNIEWANYIPDPARGSSLDDGQPPIVLVHYHGQYYRAGFISRVQDVNGAQEDEQQPNTVADAMVLRAPGQVPRDSGPTAWVSWP